MDAPPAGARDRRGVPAAVPAVPVAGRHPAAAARAAMDHFRRRRRCSAWSAGGWCRQDCPARSSRSRNTGWRSTDAGLRDLCSHPVDRAADRAAGVTRGAQAAAARRVGDCRLAARADLSRRAGGRARWRIEIQHLAADRRRGHAAARPAAVHQPALAQSVREHPDGSVQPPAAGRRDLAVGDAARSSMHGATQRNVNGAFVLAAR